jgi:hypothetical protein
MKSVRINAARERFGGLPKFGVNAAEAVILQKNARSVRLMRQSIGFRLRTSIFFNHRLPVGNPVFCGPILFDNPIVFFLRDGDQMLPAAPRARMAGPILNRRQFELDFGHRLIVTPVGSKCESEE